VRSPAISAPPLPPSMARPTARHTRPLKRWTVLLACGAALPLPSTPGRRAGGGRLGAACARARFSLCLAHGRGRRGGGQPPVAWARALTARTRLLRRPLSSTNQVASARDAPGPPEPPNAGLAAVSRSVELYHVRGQTSRFEVIHSLTCNLAAVCSGPGPGRHGAVASSCVVYAPGGLHPYACSGRHTSSVGWPGRLRPDGASAVEVVLPENRPHGPGADVRRRGRRAAGR